MDCIFHNSTENNKAARIGYNVHSLYGIAQSSYTYVYLQYSSDAPNPTERNMVLTRSSFPGGGQFASHYISNVGHTYEDMRHTISSIFSFQLFGFPHTGADVCGSDSIVIGEVCARWYQLAAFYPLARSNYNGTFGLKEPWGLEEKYRQSAINSIITRYSLIRYFYTIFFDIYQNGGSFWRPLFFEFSNDECLKNIEETFMIGKSVKVTPVLKSLKEGEMIKSYIPPHSRFIDLVDWTTILDGGSTGGYKLVNPRWEYPLVHLRDGRILPYQDFNQSLTTNELVTKHGISLLIFRDSSDNAEGSVYIDKDGVSEETIDKDIYQYYKITYNQKKIRFIMTQGNDQGGSLDANQIIEKITILDASNLKDTNFACRFNENMDYLPLNYTYNSTLNTFTMFLDPLTSNSLLELRTLKGVMFGNDQNDTNYCGVRYKVSNIMATKTGPNAGKSIALQVEPNHLGMYSFVANFTLIQDNLINVDFEPDVEEEPFHIPSIVLNSSIYPIETIYATGDISSYVTLPKEGEDFYFEIHTKDNPKDILYSTKDQPLCYDMYYKQMTAKVYTDGKLFGLGERVGEFWLTPGTYTVWNSGPEVQVEDDGEAPGKSLYGSHPVLFVKRLKKNEFFVVYDHNTSPQDFNLQLSKDGIDVATAKASGRTNLFFIMSGRLEDVTKTYYNLIGKPILPPEWAFGWHQSRFGYTNTAALKAVLEGYRNASIPLDAIWSDVDYLEDFKDFTIDEENFPDLAAFISGLHKLNVHWVPIIGSGISAGDSDAYFDGKKEGVFIKSNNDNLEPLIGRSTPGDCVFVDFFEPRSGIFWGKQLDNLFKKTGFDGLWLDMNEITNYCDGVCYESQKAVSPYDNKLLYWPGGRDLETRTISLDAKHYAGYREIDFHSLYGLLQSYWTKQWFDKKNQRAFIMSRSTFTGSGKYSQHWTGDNNADYQWMGNSVSSAYLFNFFGMPFVGSDI